MDLAKFLSLIETSSLYFCRLDQLSEFDPFEGYYTQSNLSIDKLKFDEMSDEWKERMNIKDENGFNKFLSGHKQVRNVVKYDRSVTFVNSWYIKEHESSAMWKIYSDNNYGIAIQSTYQKLIDSFASYDDFDINIGRIKYIDYEKDVIPMGNLLSPFMYKRKIFEYEDELRALIWTPQNGKNDMINPSKNRYANVFGLYVKVDLNILIDTIFISPNAQLWIVDVIKGVIEKYGFKKEVKQSNLSSKPSY